MTSGQAQARQPHHSAVPIPEIGANLGETARHRDQVAITPDCDRQTVPLESPGAIFIRFLKFGCLAWGGPAAQIAMIKRECVEEEGWLDEVGFQRLLAVYQVLPGPEAHELCVYFGRLRGGKLGGLMAGLGFMMPGFLLMLGLSALYVEAEIAAHLDALFYGLSAAVGALVARALVRLSGSFIRDVPLALIAIAGFVLTLLAGANFVLVLLGGGISYEIWRNARAWIGHTPSLSISLPAVLWIGAGAITIGLTAEIFLEGLKAGLLTFGGAYTVIPLLHDTAVGDHQWLTESQFVDGLAIGGVLPAPLIIFATFVGYLAGGLVGALAITLAIFIPAFLFPIFFHRQLVAIAENERLHQFLLGVAAGVIGLIAAVTVEIVDAGVVDLYTAALAVGAFLALNRWHGKLTVLYVVLSCGAIGAALQLTVV
jgi:chromate transporter